MERILKFFKASLRRVALEALDAAYREAIKTVREEIESSTALATPDQKEAARVGADFLFNVLEREFSKHFDG